MNLDCDTTYKALKAERNVTISLDINFDGELEGSFSFKTWSDDHIEYRDARRKR